MRTRPLLRHVCDKEMITPVSPLRTQL